jgi:hypothetical protein
MIGVSLKLDEQQFYQSFLRQFFGQIMKRVSQCKGDYLYKNLFKETKKEKNRSDRFF